MTTYASTGASGQLGRLAVHALLARGVPASHIVAVVRDPEKAADLADRGVQVRKADYDDPSAVATALAGVDRLLLISSSEAGRRVAHHTNVIEAAQVAGSSRIAYTSMLNADNSGNPLAGEHQDSEQVLRESGVPFTLLRNGWYTENYSARLSEYLERREILGAAGNGRISAATRQDYADAAVTVLLSDDVGNPVYELGGPAFDLPELARVISDVAGTSVEYRDVSAGEYAALLRERGLDADAADLVARLDASIARGELETASNDLARLLGRAPTSLADVLAGARPA